MRGGGVKMREDERREKRKKVGERKEDRIESWREEERKKGG